MSETENRTAKPSELSAFVEQLRDRFERFCQADASGRYSAARFMRSGDSYSDAYVAEAWSNWKLAALDLMVALESQIEITNKERALAESLAKIVSTNNSVSYGLAHPLCPMDTFPEDGRWCFVATTSTVEIARYPTPKFLVEHLKLNCLEGPNGIYIPKSVCTGWYPAPTANNSNTKETNVNQEKENPPEREISKSDAPTSFFIDLSKTPSIAHRSISLKAFDYRLANKSDGTLVLQGCYTWHEGLSKSGIEWRDLPTVSLDDEGKPSLGPITSSTGFSRFIFQTKFGVGADVPSEEQEDCTECAVATYLGIPRSEVPNFHGDDGSVGYWDRIDKFFASRGLYIHMFNVIYTFPCLYLAMGSTARDTNHFVVMKDGELFHDPHPSGAGLTKISYVLLAVPMDPAEYNRNV